MNNKLVNKKKFIIIINIEINKYLYYNNYNFDLIIL